MCRKGEWDGNGGEKLSLSYTMFFILAARFTSLAAHLTVHCENVLVQNGNGASTRRRNTGRPPFYEGRKSVKTAIVSVVGRRHSVRRRERGARYLAFALPLHHSLSLALVLAFVLAGAATGNGHALDVAAVGKLDPHDS